NGLEWNDRAGEFHSWHPSHNGIRNGVVYFVGAVPDRSTDIYAGLLDGMHRTADLGATWQSILYRPISAIAAGPDHALFAGGAQGVFKSLDDGATCSDPLLVGRTVQTLVSDPTAPSTLYAGTRAGVFKTTDAAATWNPLSNGMGTPVVNALAIGPSATSTLLAATAAGAYRSTNGGLSWSLAGGIPAQAVYALPFHPSASSPLLPRP